MKFQPVPFLLLIMLALMAGGCKPQPQPQAQADFDAAFTLKTMMLDGRMVFQGVGGEIDAVTNPELLAQPGSTVQITLINADGMPHDLAIPDLGVQTTLITAKEQTTRVIFEINEAGEFAYYCSVAGHRQAGMEGRLISVEP